MRSSLHFALTAAILAASLFVRPAAGETMTAEKTLETLFTAEKVDMSRFAAGFLAQIPAAQVTQIISSIRQSEGSLIGVDATENGFMLRFERAEVPARITLDAEGRIIGLWFGPARAQGDIGTLIATIKALPGHTSLLVTTDGKPIAAYEADTPLAVGSAAKLAVLLAVKRAIAQGRFSWDSVVKLDPSWKSLPSGQLQDWPDSTPITIATLVHLMISISDNTATDALIRLVGREAVDAITPRNTPFLTTRELFTLKTQESVSLRREWQGGDAALRRTILDRIADVPLPRPDAISPAATYEVEWFMTARELCGLLDATADLPSVGINAGPVDRDEWRTIAYKGGSEVGVLNLSSRLTDKNGRVYCVVATWNGDGSLDENKLISPYRGLLRRLATLGG